jgi:hypothetical protein
MERALVSGVTVCSRRQFSVKETTITPYRVKWHIAQSAGRPRHARRDATSKVVEKFEYI